MARRKLVRVADIERARTRLAAVKSIDPALDLGSGITIGNYETAIVSLATNLENYNTTLSTIDDLYNVCIAQITIIRDWNERVLTGVATKFGKNSSQYEMAGGKRKSEQRRKRKNDSTPE